MTKNYFKISKYVKKLCKNVLYISYYCEHLKVPECPLNLICYLQII